MNKSAKVMFEELGYKQEKHQDEPYIVYTQENELAQEQIEFRLYSKNVWISGYRKNLKRLLPCPIDMKELQAINKQCEELGWLDE